MRRGQKILLMIGIGVLCIGAMFLAVWGFQYFWNWLVPDIFGWKAITYWQALGLLILFQFIFKGFRFSNGGRWNRRWNEKWNDRWKQKWHNMSPEDRDRFRQKMRERCGWMYNDESNQEKPASGFEKKE